MMKLILGTMLIWGLGSGLATDALAANPKPKASPVPAWSPVDYVPFDAAAWPSLKTKSSREPASAEYNEVVGKILATKNASDLQKIIDETRAGYANLKDNSAKFLAEHLFIIEGARGAFWRLRPLLEKRTDLTRLAQSSAVSIVKQTVAAVSVLNPTPHALAFLDYFAAPYSVDGALAKQFRTELDVQTWLHSDIRPRIARALPALQAIAKSGTGVHWNQQLGYGPKSFPDGVGRDLTFGPEEIQFLIGTYELNLAQIDVFCAYNQNGILEFNKQVGRLYGFDGFLLSDVDGITGIELAKVLRDPQNRGLWTLNSTEDFGKKAMAEAYTYNRSAAARMTEAWRRLKDRPAGQNFSLPPELVRMDMAKSDLYVENLNRIVNDQPIRSNVTGETAKLNFKELFLNPPADLKAFFPTQFETRRTLEATVPVGASTSKVSYRNFQHGLPQAWDLPIYQKYADVQNQADIARTLRVLNHSTGGFAAR
ncbi:MAG: hypothetical protein KF767_05810 [Bdellovibrionaceae bacterium]|nr:hypothetical protein [Pseudobdellovibrionaceae bacterium]